MTNMGSTLSTRTWTADMSDKEELERMKKALENISQTAAVAMIDTQSAKALMHLRWIKKLAERGLGKSDD